MSRPPYVLVVASQKGGTGRTTAALALAWAFGQAGRAVALIDADPLGAARQVACGPSGRCAWANVRCLVGPAALDALRPGELAVVDAPSLLAAGAAALLRRADGLVLTGLADPVSLRTFAAAGVAIGAAQDANPKLELLGLLVGLYAPDPVQDAVLARLRRSQPGLVLEPPIPFDEAVRDWPADPGAPPPAGPALEAFRAAARALDAAITPAPEPTRPSPPPPRPAPKPRHPAHGAA